MPGDEFPNVPSSEHMTGGQMLTIVSLERTGGCVSLAAVMLIFVAYYLFPGVRNVQNTFIVFASIANVGASIASVMARAGLSRGRESSLCQAQSFLFEMCVAFGPEPPISSYRGIFVVYCLLTCRRLLCSHVGSCSQIRGGHSRWPSTSSSSSTFAPARTHSRSGGGCTASSAMAGPS